MTRLPASASLIFGMAVFTRSRSHDVARLARGLVLLLGVWMLALAAPLHAPHADHAPAPGTLAAAQALPDAPAVAGVEEACALCLWAAQPTGVPPLPPALPALAPGRAVLTALPRAPPQACVPIARSRAPPRSFA